MSGVDGRHGAAAVERLEDTGILTTVRVVCRQFPRVEALTHAVEIIDGFADCCGKWTLERALETRNEWLVARAWRFLLVDQSLSARDKALQYRRAAAVAVGVGKVSMVRRLYEEGSNALGWEVAVMAALVGDLRLLKWIWAEKPKSFKVGSLRVEEIAYDVAAKRGHLETIVETFLDQVWPLGPAVLGGRLDVIQWLHGKENIDDFTRESHGLLTKFTSEICFLYASKCTEREEIQDAMLLTKYQGKIIAATNNMDWAADNGHLGVLEWLRSNRGYGCSAEAVENAARNGDLKVLSWLHEQYSFNFAAKAMDLAAEHGKLDAVKWFHANRSEGCTKLAMDSAARYGHLGVVQWLHANRKEGCSVAAMNLAARNDHLKVVQWLHSNRSEGCSTKAMNSAAGQGHLHVVQWLQNNRMEGCTTDAMEWAAANGHLEVVKFLCANRSEGTTRVGLAIAKNRGHHDVVRCIEENHSKLVS